MRSSSGDRRGRSRGGTRGTKEGKDQKATHGIAHPGPKSAVWAAKRNFEPTESISGGAANKSCMPLRRESTFLDESYEGGNKQRGSESPVDTYLDRHKRAGKLQQRLEKFRRRQMQKIQKHLGEYHDDPRHRNTVHKRWGSLQRYEEELRKRAEKCISKHAQEIGFADLSAQGAMKITAWSSFGKRFKERRAQNDRVINHFQNRNRDLVELSSEVGGKLCERARAAGLDLNNYNDPRGVKIKLFDNWNRKPQNLTLDLKHMGDVVTVTWSPAEQRLTPGCLTSSRDEFTFFRGNKKWLLVDFEATMTAEWGPMKLVEVTLVNPSLPKCSAGSSGEDHRKTSKLFAKSSEELMILRECERQKEKPTPRLKLTDLGTTFHKRLNQDVRHLFLQRQLRQKDYCPVHRNDINNPRLSFLGALNHTVNGYNSRDGK